MQYAAARVGLATGPAMPSPAPAVALLAAAAGLRPLLWVLAQVGVFVPYSQHIVTVLGLAGVVATLVFVHGAFTAMRGRTSFSPGMTVGAWFIPVANLVLPALVLRDGWRTANGRGGNLAFLWMIAWWFTTALTVLGSLGLQFVSSGGGPVAVVIGSNRLFDVPGMSIETLGLAYGLFALVVHVLAYGVLAHLVNGIGRAAKR